LHLYPQFLPQRVEKEQGIHWTSVDPMDLRRRVGRPLLPLQLPCRRRLQHQDRLYCLVARVQYPWQHRHQLLDHRQEGEVEEKVPVLQLEYRRPQVHQYQEGWLLQEVKPHRQRRRMDLGPYPM
jgi:hypothetical protein